MKHIVALSGGKDSTAMALALNELEPRNYIYVCTPTGDELPEMLGHWRRLEDLLSAELVVLRAKHDLNGLIDHWNALPNGRMRWCTRVLKIEPFQAYVTRLAQTDKVTVYVGLRADEQHRTGSVYSLPVKQRFPMREWGWDESDVWKLLNRKRVRIPKRSDCARCFFQRLGEWWELWNNHPDIFDHAVGQESKTGYTFRRKNRDTWPVELEGMRQRFKAGDVPNIRQHPQDINIQGQTDLFDDDPERCLVCEL